MCWVAEGMCGVASGCGPTPASVMLAQPVTCPLPLLLTSHLQGGDLAAPDGYLLTAQMGAAKDCCLACQRLPRCGAYTFKGGICYFKVRCIRVDGPEWWLSSAAVQQC